MNNILIRSLTGAVFISIILIPLFFANNLIIALVFGLFMLIGLIEFYKLFQKVNFVDVSWSNGLFYGLLTYAISVFILLNSLPVKSYILLIPIPFLIIIIEIWKKNKNPLINSSILVFGIIYITVPFVLIILIQTIDNNTFPILAGMFILIWINDTFAYLSGRIIGKRKLFERISPNKTWEGAIGGSIFTILSGVAMSCLFDPEHLFFWSISAIIIVPCAIFGDLIESLFKRSVNIKDTGNIMPGHGGILDRFDATFIVVPFFLIWHIIYPYFL